MTIHEIYLIIGQMFIFLFFISIGYIFYREIRLTLYEKRINRFSMSSKKKTKLSLLEKLKYWFNALIINNNTKLLKRFSIMRKYKKKYDSYINQYRHPNRDGFYYVSIKFAVAFFFLFLALISLSFQAISFRFYFFIMAFLFGFFLPDLFFDFNLSHQKQKLKDQLLKAIIILNSHLAYEKSIIKSFALVKDKLEGEIKQEFESIYTDLCYGLSLSIIFERFFTRTQLGITLFLSSAMKVNELKNNELAIFKRCEKILYEDKQKYQLRQFFISVYNYISNVLISLPLIICMSFLLVEKKYYQVFFASSQHFIIFIFILICYGLYIYLVKWNRRKIK